jgi:hypothetical protein
MVPRTPPLSERHSRSGCIEFSAVLQTLDSFFPPHCQTSAKDMLPFNKTQIVIFSLKLSTFTFILLMGTFCLLGGIFLKISGREMKITQRFKHKDDNTGLTENFSTSTELCNGMPGIFNCFVFEICFSLFFFFFFFFFVSVLGQICM